jgi:4-amino-4-deoxy-L-arabinose transferase-like glycosyltransferase
MSERGVRPSRIHLAASVTGAALALALVAIWIGFTPDAVLKSRLARWQFWTLQLQFLAVVATSAHQLPRLMRGIGAGVHTWMAAAACCGLCLTLTAVVAPRTSRIFFDEQIYQSIGRSLADTRVAEMCNDGAVEYGRLQCWSGEYNKQPYAYPYLLSLAYRVTGSRPSVAHVVNNLAATGLVFVVFLLAALLFQDRRAAIGAALVMALVPMQLVWSNTAASEPTAALACALAVLAAMEFVRTRSTPAFIWTLSTTIFAASFRPECVLVAPLVLGLLGVKSRSEFARPRFWWWTAAAVGTGWNVLAHAVAVRNESWGAVGERMALSHVGRNIATNGWFYFWDERFPAGFTLLALVGLALRFRSGAGWLLAYFGLFWGVFLLFYAGSYDYGADVRYSLMTYAPLAALAGVGLAAIVERMGRVVGASRALPVIAAVVLFYGSSYFPLVRSVGEEAWAARADVAFVDRVIPTLPQNSVVLSHTPSVFLVRGVNAAQTSIAQTNEPRVAHEFFDRYAGGVYLHWNFWCNVADPSQQAFCNDALKRFEHTLIVEERVRNYRFGLYKLRAPAEKVAARSTGS